MGDTLRCRYCMIALNSKKEPFAMDRHRCAHEKTCYANRQDADRSNTKTSKRVQKEMRIEMEQSRPTVGSNDEDLATVYGFQYLVQPPRC